MPVPICRLLSTKYKTSDNWNGSFRPLIFQLLFKIVCLPCMSILIYLILLQGHRLRFLKQFKALRQFYLQSSTLQYFKTLIQVPYLDEVIII